MQLTLGGDSIFGLPLSCNAVLNPSAQQIAAFFGISGVQSISGGSRGRIFQIRGLWIGATIADIRNAETTLETYADGIARTLAATYADGSSKSWRYVTHVNVYSPTGKLMLRAETGDWLQEYRLQLRGLV